MALSGSNRWANHMPRCAAVRSMASAGTADIIVPLRWFSRLLHWSGKVETTVEFLVKNAKFAFSGAQQHIKNSLKLIDGSTVRICAERAEAAVAFNTSKQLGRGAEHREGLADLGDQFVSPVGLAAHDDAGGHVLVDPDGVPQH